MAAQRPGSLSGILVIPVSPWGDCKKSPAPERWARKKKAARRRPKCAGFSLWRGPAQRGNLVQKQNNRQGGVTLYYWDSSVVRSICQVLAVILDIFASEYAAKYHPPGKSDLSLRRPACAATLVPMIALKHQERQRSSRPQHQASLCRCTQGRPAG